MHIDELIIETITSIKTAFKDKTINITVTDTVDETEYLLQSPANKEHLLKSMSELESGKSTSFTLEEFQREYRGIV